MLSISKIILLIVCLCVIISIIFAQEEIKPKYDYLFNSDSLNQNLNSNNLVKYDSNNLLRPRKESSVVYFNKGFLNISPANFSFSSFSIILMIYFPNIKQNSIVFYFGDKNNTSVLYLNNKTLIFSSNNQNKSLENDILFDKWYHLCLTFGNNFAKIYLDGYEEISVSFGSSNYNPISEIIIGKGLGSEKLINLLEAYIQEIRLYSFHLNLINVINDQINTKYYSLKTLHHIKMIENESNSKDRNKLFNVTDKSDSGLWLKKTYIELLSRCVNLNKSLTIIIWLKLESFESWSPILTIVSDKNNVKNIIEFGLHFGTTKLYACLHLKNDQICLNTDYNLELKKWHHLTLAIDDDESKMTIYVNGTSLNSTRLHISESIEISNSSLYVGKSLYDEKDELIDAVFYDIKIFNYCLISEEILTDLLNDFFNISTNLPQLNYVYQKELYVDDAELKNHWDMSSKIDRVGKMNLKDGELQFEKDRLGRLKSAVSLKSNSYKLPSGVYFNSDFSLLVWLNLKTLTKKKTVIHFGNQNNQDVVKMDISGHKVRFFVSNQKRERSIEINDLKLDKWYHVAFVVKNTIGYVYINGVFQERKYLLNINNVNRQHNCIGKMDYNEDNDGEIILDDIKIYKEALSESKIEQLIKEDLVQLDSIEKIWLFILQNLITFFTTLILILTAIVLLIIIIIVRRKSAKNKAEKRRAAKTEILLENMYTDLNIRKDTFDLEKLPEIDTKNLELMDHLGNGTFGLVYYGKYKPNQITEIEVAIKKCKPSISEADKRDFFQEALLLNSCEHKNLIKILGVTFSDKKLDCIVMEFMNSGDLLSYLRNTTNVNNMKIQHFISFSADISDACRYLEDVRLVHRDIAARNCLITKNKNDTITVKLGDFGLARGMASKDYYKIASGKMVPVKWMSPESIEEGMYTNKSDVWSFGILMGEILSLGAQPYKSLSNEEAIDFINNRQIQIIAENCPKEISSLLRLCWSYESNERPNFKSLEFLFRILNEMIKNEELTKLDDFPNFETDCDSRIKSLILSVKSNFKTISHADPLPYFLRCF